MVASAFGSLGKVFTFNKSKLKWIISILLIILLLFGFYLIYNKDYITIFSYKVVTSEEVKTKSHIKFINPYEKRIDSYIKSKYKRVSPVIVNEISKQVKLLYKNYNIEIPIIIGIIEVESGFNPTLVSNKNARGLMQVRYSVWEKVLNEKLKLTNEFDLHIIKNGIESGLIVLNHYLEKNYGDLDKTLFLYCGKSEQYVIKVKTAICNFIIFKEK